MQQKEIRVWKKAFETDLQYVAFEVKDLVTAPALIILKGELGAGKTTFCQSFLGKKEQVLSPSYSVINEYQDSLHADFYRIQSAEEIVHLELALYLEQKNFFLVEWGEKYFGEILRELPEAFNSYLLEISINKESETVQNESRDFALYTLKES